MCTQTCLDHDGPTSGELVNAHAVRRLQTDAVADLVEYVEDGDEVVLRKRIQGFGNDQASSDSRPSRKKTDVEVIPEADYFWHAVVDVAETLGLSSVLESVDYVVHGCSGAQKCNLSKTSMPRAVGVATRLKHWGPGTYRVLVQNVAVSSSAELGGDCIARLQRNDVVDVEEVVYRPAEQRLRGRIDKGWFSLLNTEDGSYWVSKQRSRAKDPLESCCEKESLPSVPKTVVNRRREHSRGYAGPIPRISPPPGSCKETPVEDLINLDSGDLAHVMPPVDS